MKKISVIHPFYNHNRGLLDHIKNWNQWSKKNKDMTEIIIVDDGSPDRIDLNIFNAANGLDIKVFRIEEDIRWNVTGARNLGITQSEGEWLFPLDFDMSVLEETFNGFFNEALDKNTTYWPRLWFPSQKRPDRMRSPHVNSFFIFRETMMKSGLYDEDFAGMWGWEDIFFHNCILPGMGVNRKEMDKGHIRWYKLLACRTQHGEVVQKRAKDRSTSNYYRMENKIKQYNRGEYKNGPILRFNWERIK